MKYSDFLLKKHALVYQLTSLMRGFVEWLLRWRPVSPQSWEWATRGIVNSCEKKVASQLRRGGRWAIPTSMHPRLTWPAISVGAGLKMFMARTRILFPVL